MAAQCLSHSTADQSPAEPHCWRHGTQRCCARASWMSALLPALQVWDGGGPKTAFIVKKSGSARTSAALRKIGAW
jgi:hypothetical protein